MVKPNTSLGVTIVVGGAASTRWVLGPCSLKRRPDHRSIMDIFSFVLASLALLLTPGPTNTLLAAAGAMNGVRRSMTLPLAEAIGYAFAISAFHAAMGYLAPNPAAIAALRAVAALWLMYSAIRLWRQPSGRQQPQPAITFSRIVVTTALNPKAMILGTVLIPSLMPTGFLLALSFFLILSLLAGSGWMVLGTAIPDRIKTYSYRAAAVILGGFAVAAGFTAFQP